MKNLPQVSLTQWAIFNAVVDNGGYLRASKYLNRSHSSVHHAVNKLQLQLGVQLLEIDGKTPRLTAIGEVMHRRSQQLLKDADELEKLASFLGEGWEPEITLAVENIFPNNLLNPILDIFYQQNSVSRLKIETVVLNGAVETIRNGSADLVITPIVPSGYLGTPLTQIQLYPIAHKNHPLIWLDKPVRQRDLIAQLQIVISDTARATDGPSLGWLKAEQRWTVSDFHHAKDILMSGKGFCWIPDYLVATELASGELCKIETEDEFARSATLHLVIPKRDQLGPGAELLARLIKEEGKKHLPPLIDYSEDP